ncbi:hypothetical protein K8U54_00970 [Pseudomonas fulva]|uniref:carbamoyltransferase family protein n=1 Tax=Pseudomonas fulva TaxID=47880 RepID=UPI00201D4807|nr:carbamoyltransferase C-terminal domain-containing protein [Pseudomonas fulva]UQY35108.1 hypothetical protein K8U54_00970 [Pseudomonas fulva]
MTIKNAYLGVNLLHDTSAAILYDGVLVAAVEQERFDGIRHSTNFPHEAIDFCLKEAGLKLENVKNIGVTFDYSSFIANNRPFEQNTVNHDDTHALGQMTQITRNLSTYRHAIQSMRESGLGNFISVRHHLCHAAGTFFSSGFDRSNILIADGRGEDEATSLYHGNGISIEKLKSYPIKDSLGHLYTYITSLCGLYSYIGQEGKTMGLASYGSGRVSIIDSVLRFAGDSYFIDREAMRELKNIADKKAFSDKSKDLAYAVQKAIEKAFVFLAEDLYKKTGNHNFCLAGGVALNCNANGLIAELDFVENIYIQPAANDAGAAIGAAMLLHVGDQETRPVVKEQVYLGPHFSSNEIESYLTSEKIPFEIVENPHQDAAKLINSGMVIGWCQGKMEFGPRALGNRSILAAPTSAAVRDRVNIVKQRESWRPLAPSVLSEHAADWFHVPAPSPFMLITMKVREKYRDLVAAISHVDGTARVQTVSREDNKKYYDLISEYHKLSGIPMVLNTSLNTKGKPIVSSPADCIECLYESGLDAIFIGDYLIYNKANSKKEIKRT